MNISSVENAKKQINILEKDLEDLNFEGKCVQTINEISAILVRQTNELFFFIYLFIL